MKKLLCFGLSATLLLSGCNMNNNAKANDKNNDNTQLNKDNNLHSNFTNWEKTLANKGFTFGNRTAVNNSSKYGAHEGYSYTINNITYDVFRYDELSAAYKAMVESGEHEGIPVYFNNGLAMIPRSAEVDDNDEIIATFRGFQ